jgi:hypothetical protein
MAPSVTSAKCQIQRLSGTREIPIEMMVAGRCGCIQAVGLLIRRRGIK